ncbi:MAG: class I SAM-dependent rRNA methyltransferase [Clostridiales bacterium]|nr:class I SAM-dependent rRNA methyltransferase [Clostridiales bacterium]
MVKGKESNVEYGHPWIYRSDINTIDGTYEPGDVIDVFSSKNRFLGQGYINMKSQISIRMLTTGHEAIDRDFFYDRIKTAWEYRLKVADPMSCRVVFSESDFLPGLIVDKFEGILVLQTSSLGIERYKPWIVGILNEIIKPDGIYERNDITVRELEGLEQKKGFLSDPFDTLVEMKENGIKFIVDVENGQKTGFFLDQKENRAALKPFVKGARVLDCFCHTGSFSLHAGHYGAAEVTGIDVSAHAVESATRNAVLNGLENVCSFVQANAFDKLREYHDSGEKFDVVVLDPPAFTKTRNAVEGAARGYKEINLRAMQIIKSGGYLITCSCSHHVDSDLFMDLIYNAAYDAKKKARLVEYRSQGKDHPVLLASSETEYLKCAILQIF